MISSLDDLSEEISRYFEAKDRAREEALALTRVVVRRSGAAIRSVHRSEFDRAKELTEEAGRSSSGSETFWPATPTSVTPASSTAPNRSTPRRGSYSPSSPSTPPPPPRRWGSR